MRNKLRIIFISPNRLVHNHWHKAIDAEINIYSENDIKSFEFFKEDIILFDLDNLETYLDLVLNSNLICLSSKLNEIKGFKLLKEGIKAYGNTYMTPMNLKNAIDTVKTNKIWIYPELMSFIINNSTISASSIHSEKIDELSSREFEVSKYVSKGLSNRDIAKELSITERTVKAHISSIFMKLDIKDRVSLGIMIKEYIS